MTEKPEDSKQDFDSWFLGGGGGGEPIEDQPTAFPPEPKSNPPLTADSSKQRIWENEAGPKQSASNPPPPPVPSPPIIDPAPVPPKPPTRIGPVLAAVAAVALLGGGAFYFYPRPAPPPEPIPIPEPVPQPKPPEPVPVPIPDPDPPPVPVPPVKVDPSPPKRIKPIEPPPVKPPERTVTPLPPPKDEAPIVKPPAVDTTPKPKPPPERIRLLRPENNTTVVEVPRLPAYTGPSAGVINWSGRLEKNGSVTIDGTAAQSGTLNGALPGVPVMIDVDASEFAIAEAPSPSNGWRRLVIRSRRKTHSVVTIRWTVLQE